MDEHDRPRLVAAARTHVGHVRQRNEDCAVLAGTVLQAEHDGTAWDGDDVPVLLAVLDGLGGHPDGDVASRLAGRSLVAADDPTDVPTTIRSAHDAVRAAIGTGGGASGVGGREMGTTVALAVVEQDQVLVASLGDSPALLVGDDRLELLTEPHRGALGGITAFLGIGGDRSLAPRVRRLARDRPQRLLLATDGLSDYVDGDVAHAAARGGTPSAAAEALVRAALDNGAPDNVTVVVADVAATAVTGGDDGAG